jgi:mannose-6-phosphate isomerase-like protein (cupin superfamily)
LHAEASDYQAGECLPPTSAGYSPWWDFWSGWQRSLSTWFGQERHFHTKPEEYYVVLRGSLELEVQGSVIPVVPGSLVGVRAGAPHVVVGGQEPVDTFLVRVPGGRGDKTLADSHHSPNSTARRDTVSQPI